VKCGLLKNTLVFTSALIAQSGMDWLTLQRSGHPGDNARLADEDGRYFLPFEEGSNGEGMGFLTAILFCYQCLFS